MRWFYFSALQIFSPEVTLIRDQVFINIGAYLAKILETTHIQLYAN